MKSPTQPESQLRAPSASISAAALILGLLVVGCTPQWASLGDPDLRIQPQPNDATAGAVGDGERTPAFEDRRAKWATPVAPVKAPQETLRLDGLTPSELSDKVWSYFIDNIGHRFYVQTDRALYRPLETVWIKTWDVQTRTMSGYPVDTGILVQLVSPDGVVLQRKVIRQSGGFATNDLVIPAGSRSGEYRLRLVTEDEGIYERPIVVMNDVEAKAAPFGAALTFDKTRYAPGDTATVTLQVDPTIARGFARQTLTANANVDGERLAPASFKIDRRGAATFEFTIPETFHGSGHGVVSLRLTDGEASGWVSAPIPLDADKLRFDAFPEGGNLVAGLPGRVYFQARDRNGVPVKVGGRVEDDRGKIVTNFEARIEGMGRFAITPEAGRTYKAIVVEPEVNKGTFPLPEVKAEGCTLSSIDDYDTQRKAIRVEVYCATPQTVLVSAVLRETLIDVAYVLATPDAPAIVYLRSKDDGLSKAQGVARVTVWDDWFTPMAERVVYRNRRERLDLQVQLKDNVHSPGDVAELHIFSRGPDGAPIKTNLSLAVVDDTLLNVADDDYGRLDAHLFLGDALTGDLPTGGPYFDLTDPQGGEALDLLLGVRGYRKFEWQRIVEPKDRDDDVDARTRGAIIYAAPDFDLSEDVSGLLAPRPGSVERLERVERRLRGLGEQYLRAVATRKVEGSLVPTVQATPKGEEPKKDEAPATEPAKKDEPAPDAGPRKSLSKDDVVATIQRYQLQLGRCAQGNSAVIKARIEILPTGTVKSAAVTNAAKGTDEGRCVAATVKKFIFPAWEGKMLTLNYPFIMKGMGWAPVRVFPIPKEDRSLEAKEKDRRQTVLWAPNVQTDAEGRAVVRVPLSSVATTYRALAQGLGYGYVGRDTLRFSTLVPFTFKAEVASTAARGDTIDVPVTLGNKLAKATSLNLYVQLGPGLERVDKTPSSLPAKPLEQLEPRVQLKIAGAERETWVRILASKGAARQEVYQKIKVVPTGFIHDFTASGLANGTVGVELAFKGAQEGSLTTRAVFLPNMLSQLDYARAGLADYPMGGSAAALVEAWTIARLLEGMAAARIEDPARNTALRKRLLILRARVEAAMANNGGVAHYPNGPADAVLTGVAVEVFARWRPFEPAAVGAMADKAVAWLSALRNGAGSFNASAGHDAPAHPSKDVRDAFLAATLAKANDKTFVSEVLAASSRAEDAKDPYLLALAILTLSSTPAGHALTTAANKRLAAAQDGSGAWVGADHSVQRGDPETVRLETTALGLKALLKSLGNLPRIRRAVQYLAEHRAGDGTWGSPLTTLLVLDALAEYDARSSRRARPGKVSVTLDGKKVAERAYDADKQVEPVVVDGLEGFMTQNTGFVQLIHDSRGDIPFTLESTHVESAAQHGLNPEFSFQVTGTGVATVGQRFEVTAAVTNSSAHAHAHAAAVIYLPAGVRLAPDALDTLRSAGHAVETDGNAIRLGLTNLAPNTPTKVVIPVVAAFPGRFSAQASLAQVPSRASSRVWAPGLTVSVSPAK